VNIEIGAGTRTAIIGPTAAGKTQLIYIMVGLLNPTSGAVYYDGKNINEYDKAALHRQVGLVFQDSIIFNISLRENIAFSASISAADMEKAIAAAELDDFIEMLSGQTRRRWYPNGELACRAAKNSALRWLGRWRSTPGY